LARSRVRKSGVRCPNSSLRRGAGTVPGGFPLAQGGEDIGLAVIVSPDAATFSNVGMEYLTSQNSVPWTLIRQIP